MKSRVHAHAQAREPMQQAAWRLLRQAREAQVASTLLRPGHNLLECRMASATLCPLNTTKLLHLGATQARYAHCTAPSGWHRSDARVEAAGHRHAIRSATLLCLREMLATQAASQVLAQDCAMHAPALANLAAAMRLPIQPAPQRPCVELFRGLSRACYVLVRQHPPQPVHLR